MNCKEFQAEARIYTNNDGSTNWEKLEEIELRTLLEAKIIAGPDAGMIVQIDRQGSKYFGNYLKEKNRRVREISQEMAAKVAAQLRASKDYAITFDGGKI